MKYEKPIVRDLTGRSAAGGPPVILGCGYGNLVDNNCNPGQTLSQPGLCLAGTEGPEDYQAGNCAPGTLASPDCLTGSAAAP